MEPEPSSEVVLFNQDEEEVNEKLTFYAKRISSIEDEIEVFADQEMEIQELQRYKKQSLLKEPIS